MNASAHIRLSTWTGPFKLQLVLCIGLVGVGLSGFGQRDSIHYSKGMFVLSAGDISRNENSLDARINKKVISASLLEQFASEAPAKVYVIGKEQIKNRGYESLIDILEDIPEVEIQGLANPEFNNHISFRGVAGNEKFLIFVDGMRITPSTGDVYSVGMNFFIENAEQVEIILGPASALYGADAFSGVIQIITQLPSEAQQGRVKTSLGNYGTSFHSASTQMQFGELELMLNGSFYHADNAKLPAYYPEDFSWFNSRYQPEGEVLLSPVPSLRIPIQVEPPGGDRQFEIPTTSYFVQAQARIKNLELGYIRHGDSYSSSISTRPEYALYTRDAKFAYFVESIFARHTYTSPDFRWALQSSIGFSTYEVSPQTAFINTYTSYLPGYKYEFGKSRKIKEQASFNFSPQWNLIGGFSFEVIDALALTGDLPVPFDKHVPANLQSQHYLGSNTQDYLGNELHIFQDFHYLHYQNFGAYLQLQTQPIQELSITGGLRFDNNTRYGKTFNPRLGIVWKPHRALTAKILYGESFLSPSPRKAHQHFGSFIPRTDTQGRITGLSSPFFHLANPELEPEKLRSLEGGIRFVLSPQIVFSVDGYYTRINNLIQKFVQNTDITHFKDIPIDFVETGLNEGNASNYGASLRIDAAFSMGAWDLNGYASYSYSDGKSNQGPIFFSARNTVKTGVELNYRRLTLAPRFMYRSSTYSPLVNEETQNFYATPPYGIFHLFARFQVLQREAYTASLTGKVQNLTDRRYYNGFIGGIEGFGNVPQFPRTLRFGIEIDF